MVMHGIAYKQREMVLISFPFTNYEQYKRRPVLILSNNHFNNANKDLIVCAITSKNFKNQYSINISNNDLEYGNLPEESVILCHILHVLENNLIIKKFSILNQVTFDNVIKNIIEVIK